ncbi:MAG: hypothetical protein J6I40_07830 [Mailhella sp.]|nr:hypothetical protein [Mailhella sp.]
MSSELLLSEDEEFKRLIPPVSAAEYDRLEQSIASSGCNEPICVWNSIILDGHKRFEICMKHHLPFKIRQIRMRGRLEAMSWICSLSLARQNLTGSYRTYLIGKICLLKAEMAVRKMQELNDSAQKKGVSRRISRNGDVFAFIRICREIGMKYGLHPLTVKRFSRYAEAIDKIRGLNPKLAEDILNGRIKHRKKNFFKVSGSSTQELEAFCRNLAREGRHNSASAPDSSFSSSAGMKVHLPADAGSIKNMPRYDPDAELKSLSLTMPSWVSSIQRVAGSSSIEESTESARRVLAEELIAIIQASSNLLNKINSGASHA